MLFFDVYNRDSWPKTAHYVIICAPSSCSKPECEFLLNTKEDILKSKSWSTPLTSIVWKQNIMKVIGDQKVFDYPHYSNYFVIVCVQQKKEIHTGLEHLAEIDSWFCHSSLGRKSYVVLSVILCLLASILVAFFLFPRPVLVVDDGIRSVTVHFNRNNSKVIINMTVIPFFIFYDGLINNKKLV